MPSFLQFWSVSYRDIAETLFMGGTTVTQGDDTYFTLANGAYTVRISGSDISFDADGRMLTGEIDRYVTYEGDPALGRAVMIADSNFTLLDAATFNAAFDLARGGSMRAAVQLVMADWEQEYYSHSNYSGGFMRGMSGGDGLFGGGLTDFIFGEGGSDTVVLGGGNDIGYGGADADWLYGGTGDDLIFGGEGDDAVWADEFGPRRAGDDEVHGDAGNDGIRAGAGQDTVHGGADNDRLDGEKGSDLLFGDGGADALIGGAGFDSLDGGEGEDSLDGGWDDDRMDGADGNDGLSGAKGNDSLYGGSGADSLRGGDANDLLDGGSGDDWMRADGGDDSLFGGDGNDTLNGGFGSDEMTGGQGADRFVISGADTLPFTDYIADFELGVDKIVFANFGLASVDELIGLATDTADGVLFVLSPNRWVVVAGVEVLQLSGTDDLIVS